MQRALHLALAAVALSLVACSSDDSGASGGSGAAGGAGGGSGGASAGSGGSDDAPRPSPGCGNGKKPPADAPAPPEPPSAPPEPAAPPYEAPALPSAAASASMLAGAVSSGNTLHAIAAVSTVHITDNPRIVARGFTARDRQSSRSMMTPGHDLERPV